MTNKNGRITYADGTKTWFLNGVLHREDGPAIEFTDGTKEWYLNGNLHHEDGPAIEHANGTKYWYLNGNLHREDGPAIEYANGTIKWYINGNQLTQAEVDIHRMKKWLDNQEHRTRYVQKRPKFNG